MPMQSHLLGHLHSWAVCLSFLGLVCFTLMFGFHMSICRDAVHLRWVNFQVDLRHTAPNYSYSQNLPAFLSLETHESFCLVFSWQQTCSWRFVNNHLRLIDHTFAVQSLPQHPLWLDHRFKARPLDSILCCRADQLRLWLHCIKINSVCM